MKVLIISKDKSLFSQSGPVYEELLKCSELVDQLHVVVMTARSDTLSILKATDKLFIYPTNSRYAWLAARDACRVARFQLSFKSRFIADLAVAEDPFACATAARMVSRACGVDFMINVYEDLFSAWGENPFGRIMRRASAKRVLPEAAGIRD